MSGIVITGGTIGGDNTGSKTCRSCGVTGGGWSKEVVNGKTTWRHECGAEQ